MLIDAELLLCGLAGLLISTYITLVYYRRMSPAARIVPRACRLEEETCQHVIRTPEGKLFGLPNSLFGMGYYGGLMLYTLAGSERESAIVLAAAIGAIVYSTYLVYLLLLKLRVDCALCYTCHALNAVIGIIMIYRSV
jgi:uncharacterized membrane protein